MTTVHASTDAASPTTWETAPTHTIEAGGVEFAYRQLGPSTGVPVVFLTHLAAVLDNWDPRVVDGIAATHRVITFDNRGVGASSGSTPTTIEQMATDAVKQYVVVEGRRGKARIVLPSRGATRWLTSLLHTRATSLGQVHPPLIAPAVRVRVVNPQTAKLKTWATVDPVGTRRVVVINKDTRQTDTVVLRVPAPGAARASSAWPGRR